MVPNKYLPYLSIISDFVPVAFGTMYYRSLQFDRKVAYLMCVIAATVDITISILAFMELNNLWLLNLLSLTEGVLFLYLILNWSGWTSSKRIWQLLSIVFIGFWTYEVTLHHSIMEFNTHEKTFKGLMLMIFSGSVIFKLSLNDRTPLRTDYRFWYLSGIFVFYTITLAAYVTADLKMANNESVRFVSWYITWVAAICTNLLFSLSFLCLYQKRNT